MNPKNYRDFFEDISKDAEVHKDLVSEFVSFFYGRVRKSLSTLESTKINLPGLGTFKIRTGKLKKAIKRNKDILGNLQKMTYTGYEKHLPVKNKLEEMETVLKKVENTIKEKKQFRNENK
uniref:Uncharacterized protein n=1 Tax=Virus NIOZ-UU157 TaxID=2763269 RepID=A0A7S9SSA1_9VIRU|nr:MAG: hypothetical protein NIOZUU157_00217 [Virus NIOZ-UU157]